MYIVIAIIVVIVIGATCWARAQMLQYSTYYKNSINNGMNRTAAKQRAKNIIRYGKFTAPKKE